MIICDSCGKARECLRKEIDGREYDICQPCWNALMAKLSGKGRAKKNRETVILPPPRVIQEREDDEPQRPPGRPPKIWGKSAKPPATHPGARR